MLPAETDFDIDQFGMMGGTEIGTVDPLDGIETERPIRPNGMPTVSLNAQPKNALPLYLDIETVPDEERMHLFGLPELPEVPPETTSANCPTPATLLEVPLEQLERELLAINPDDAFLELLQFEERKKQKPRSGVETACKKIKSRRDGAKSAEADRAKLLATTPEYCRIVAVGWAIGNGPVESLVAMYSTNPSVPGYAVGEKDILEKIWDLIGKHSPIVGFNFLSFDLHVLRARSIILGVEPTKMVNDSPWNNRDVTDLMLARFGKSGKWMALKQLARLYGIPVPAGDTNGSDVAHLLANDPEKLGEYVRSDIEVTRALHQKFSGHFCA